MKIIPQHCKVNIIFNYNRKSTPLGEEVEKVNIFTKEKEESEIKKQIAEVKSKFFDSYNKRQNMLKALQSGGYNMK